MTAFFTFTSQIAFKARDASVQNASSSAYRWLWIFNREFLFPLNPAGCLHHHKQSDDRPDCNRQTGEALQEERIGKRNQINELCQRCFAGSKAGSHYQTQIRDHQKDRYYRRDDKSEMNRNVIDQIREQQVKRKEGSGEKEIIHRMQLDAAQRRDYEHQKEKEEERNWRKETNAASQRSRL